MSGVKGMLRADDCSPLIAATERGEVAVTSYARGGYPGERFQRNQLPGLRTIGFWDARGVQSWGLPMHRNEGIEICCLLSGETMFATASGEWALRPGDITVTRPWQRHQLGNPNIRASKLFWLIIDVESSSSRVAWEFPSWVGPDKRTRQSMLRIFRQNQRCHFQSPDPHLHQFVDQSCQQLAKGGDLVDAHISNTVNHVIASVAEHLESGLVSSESDPNGFDRTIREFFMGLEASLEKAAEEWTIRTMADTCRVGKSYLTRACKEMFNTTPCEYLAQIRLHHAAAILRENPMASSTQTAFLTGFGSSQYFATRFRKQFGISPLAYRDSKQPVR